MEFSFGVFVRPWTLFFGMREQCGRNNTTKNRSVSGASPPSRCLAWNFRTICWSFFFFFFSFQTEALWNSERLANAKTVSVEVFGCLWKCVDPFWLHVKTFENSCQHHLQDNWQGEENIASEKNRANREHGQKKEKGARSRLNHVSFVREPRAVTFKLLLLTETIIGLKPLCM